MKTLPYNQKNKCKIEYPSLPSAIRPVPHSDEIPVWGSRAREKHWVEKNWPPRSDLKPVDPNIIHAPFVDIKKIIFAPCT